MMDVKTSARALLGKDAYIRSRQRYYRLRRRLRSSFRTLTSALRPLPNFIILGAQKSGTTSLFNYIANHPEVSMSVKKEVHYFDLNFSEGLQWYKYYFPLSAALKDDFITGEATPYYLYHPYVPKRIASVVPEAKLIALLRNPIDRAISHYWHEVKYEAEHLSMREAFKREKDRLEGEKEKILSDQSYCSYEDMHFSYLARGKYVAQLKRYFNYFDRRQMLIIQSEDLFRDPQTAFNRVTDFLNLSAYILPDAEARNIGKYQKKPKSEIRQALQAYFRPYNAGLSNLAEIEVDW